jgi:DNA-binding beta-propeller fold protein YncE
VSNAEHTPQSPAAKTGRFASLRAASSVAKRSGAPSSDGVGGRTSSLRLLGLPVVVAAALLALAAIPASALAARGHVFSGTIGEPCTAEPCGPGKLKEPSAVAVNEASHDVYVVDQGNNRIDKFGSAAGAFIRAFVPGLRTGAPA